MIKKTLFIFVKKIINYLIKFTFFKVKKKKITFISFPDMTDNSWYLFNYINKNRNNLTLVWLVENDLSKKKINNIKKINKTNNLLFIKKKSLKGVYHFLSSRIVFFTHIPYFFSQKNLSPIQVNLWHGMPIKKIGVYRHKKLLYYYGDYAISTSPLYTKVLSKAFGIDKKSIIECGLPRNDILTSNKKIHFNKNNLNLILWLPTFRKTTTFSKISDATKESFLMEWPNNFLEILNSTAKKNKILIIIKTHPLENFKNLKKYSNIIHLKNFDLIKMNLDLHDLISISDGLISDISSVIIDYILLKKPLGITTNSIETFNRGFIDELNLFKRLNYNKIKSLTDFKNFFKIVKKNKTEIIDPKNIFYSKDAINSSQKIIKYFKI